MPHDPILVHNLPAFGKGLSRLHLVELLPHLSLSALTFGHHRWLVRFFGAVDFADLPLTLSED